MKFPLKSIIYLKEPIIHKAGIICTLACLLHCLLVPAVFALFGILGATMPFIEPVLTFFGILSIILLWKRINLWQKCFLVLGWFFLGFAHFITHLHDFEIVFIVIGICQISIVHVFLLYRPKG